jgi:hypothetical protein
MEVQACGELLHKCSIGSLERCGHIERARTSLGSRASVDEFLDVVVNVLLLTSDGRNATLSLDLLHYILLLDLLVLHPALVLVLMLEMPKFDMAQFVEQHRQPRQVDLAAIVDVTTCFW